MKTYNLENTNTPKLFNAALKDVFSSIASRNKQIQQLLILAVSEAAKLGEDGKPMNNLNWLTMVLKHAEETKGINLFKMVSYVKEELCCNTVAWCSKNSKLKKVSDKNVKLAYNTNPDIDWMNYGKKETVKKAFDYGKKVTSAITAALDEDKGGLDKKEVLKNIMDGGLSAKDIADLMIELANDEDDKVKEAA